MVLASADSLGNKDQVDSLIQCREGGMMMRFCLGKQITFSVNKLKLKDTFEKV